MGRKSNEQSYRGKGKYRTGRREKRRTVSYADEEETGNDTVVEYTTEEEETTLRVKKTTMRADDEYLQSVIQDHVFIVGLAPRRA